MKFIQSCAALLILLLPPILYAQPGHLSPQYQLDRMSSELKLSDEQRASVQPILEASYQQRMEVMQAAGVGHGQGQPSPDAMAKIRDEMWRISGETDAKLAAVLTPEQLQQYRELREQARARMREHMQQQRQQSAPADQ